ncbi:hypothetical protein H7J77_12000 [Mycolicibacillus parakoreensis]|uniref:Uncharacterized protein n=1 Tax=Mycolicibacillus parakoreensis TaxID=1069221 RepID=A0ABY3TXV0_9MYCO|nr:hypothetical protein [Mycolicibacillus parakoreensis]MCV7316258.1 hypothetical protein [Mycolicibacillus parakoreensis]ULN52508.1 hypothetical protein MIU77_16980 [Mycolicibacillus parakoreensis]HLR98647.1 hypothetical protein [Mycolicibacillus parakoreensis]
MSVRAVAAALAVLLAVVTSCSRTDAIEAPYGAQGARMGDQLSVLGWDLTVSDLRWAADHVLVDVVGQPTDADESPADPADLRFGLYGALAHPVEADGVGSCDSAVGATSTPLTAPAPDRLSGTVCLGPMTNRSAVRGVYVYSPRDRMAGTTVAYPAAFPIGLPPTGDEQTGLALSSSSVHAWRADGLQLTEAALGDPSAFDGKGQMLIGLTVDAPSARYREQSEDRGGPLMLLVGPFDEGPWSDPACAAYGSSVLVLPDASLGAVHTAVSLCTQGDLTAALLYATVSVVGTHAGVWITGE